MRAALALYTAMIAWLFERSSAMVNLFISKAEMSRTLGLSAELNYVENGVINTYSTKFPYRVDTNVSQVVFSWNTKVIDRKIVYTLRAVADDNAVLPVILIPHRGYLPTSTEDFTIEYRCAGNKAGQFDITLHVNFSWPSETNNTYVTLKQEKLCSSRDGRRPAGLILFHIIHFTLILKEIRIIQSY